MELLKKTTIALAAAVAVGVTPAVARANTITVSFVNVVPSGPNFQWNYQISEDANGRITPGAAAPGATTLASSTEGQVADYFTIYDIQGFISAAAPAGWAVQTANVGSTPQFISNPDNASVINVTFVRTGANTGAGPFTTSGFSITATFGTSINGFWSSEDTHNGGGTDGSTDWSGGQLLVPNTTVPEPATMLLVGSGLLGLGAKFRRRRNNA